jgi:hypothetical protein
MIPNIYPVAFVEPGKEPEGARTVADPVVIAFARRTFDDFARIVALPDVELAWEFRDSPDLRFEHLPEDISKLRAGFSAIVAADAPTEKRTVLVILSAKTLADRAVDGFYDARKS